MLLCITIVSYMTNPAITCDIEKHLYNSGDIHVICFWVTHGNGWQYYIPPLYKTDPAVTCDTEEYLHNSDDIRPVDLERDAAIAKYDCCRRPWGYSDRVPDDGAQSTGCHPHGGQSGHPGDSLYRLLRHQLPAVHRATLAADGRRSLRARLAENDWYVDIYVFWSVCGKCVRLRGLVCVL